VDYFGVWVLVCLFNRQRTPEPTIGWLKTIDEYFIEQTNKIISNMVAALTQVSRVRFISILFNLKYLTKTPTTLPFN
jgi:hypothetical protein